MVIVVAARSLFILGICLLSGNCALALCPMSCHCEHNDAVIYCYTGGLNTSHFYKILHSAGANVIELDIRAPAHKPNNFKWDDNINRLSQLRSLTLENCGIPALSHGTRLHKLVHLSLRNNNIDSLPMDFFNGLKNLASLDVSYNQISVLQSGTFVYLKSLVSLSLSHNSFTELPSNMLHGPTQLHELQLDNISVTYEQLNTLFLQIPNLRRLELNFCQLGDNGVSMLKLGLLPQVRRLGLGGNNLTFVPSTQLRNLAQLETVDLSFNRIRRIQPCAFCACNITSINLGHNMLGIDDNALHVESFAHTQVRQLDMSYNFFDHFDSKMLARAQKFVQVLDLSGNTIKVLHSKLVHSLPDLLTLHVAQNHIDQLPETLPIEFSTLTGLNISGNNIRNMKDSFISSLPFLKQLDISNNLLSYLDTEVVSELIDREVKVRLQGNPWNCKCASQGIQRYLRTQSPREVEKEQILCAKPSELKGLAVYRVQNINECAVLFGGQYQLTQASELIILVVIVISTATLAAALLIAMLYFTRNAKNKKRHRFTSAIEIKHLTDESNRALHSESIYIKDGFGNVDLPPPLPPLPSLQI